MGRPITSDNNYKDFDFLSKRVDALERVNARQFQDSLGTWRTIREYTAAGSTWGSSFLGDSGINGWQTASAGATKTYQVFTLDVDDYSVTGYTTVLRSVVTFSCNPTAPGINFLTGVYTVTTVSGGAGTLSWSGVASFATASLTTPAASTITEAISSEIELTNEVSNNFLIGINPSGTAAANHLAVLGVQVQMRHVPS